MSLLTIHPEDAADAGTASFTSADPQAIATALAPIGVRFERWDSPVPISPEDSSDAILEAYRPHLDQLMGQTKAGSADVLKLSPDHPEAAALRRKFLAEHAHSEDEIRFFVHGSAHFIMHTAGQVFDVLCTQGDLISVPAGLRHWFDAGSQPCFTVLRVFTDQRGWVAQYTGDRISERFTLA